MPTTKNDGLKIAQSGSIERSSSPRRWSRFYTTRSVYKCGSGVRLWPNFVFLGDDDRAKRTEDGRGLIEWPSIFSIGGGRRPLVKEGIFVPSLRDRHLGLACCRYLRCGRRTSDPVLVRCGNGSPHSAGVAKCPSIPAHQPTQSSAGVDI